jgi:hypothetical protein
MVRPQPRRPLPFAIAGAFTMLLTPFTPDVAAGCKQVGKKCGKKKCCAGARCRHRHCRCKKGWAECNDDGLCQDLSAEANHCGACDQSCATATGDCGQCNPACAAPCCVDGACRAKCGDDCCANCFVESDSVLGPPNCGTESCCPNSSICNSGTGDPGDDLCCWPDEVCLDGDCCCDGCEGTLVCGGKCCPSVSCCHGKCCSTGQVCARQQPNKPMTCVSADRSCTSSEDCFEGEECRGGACCSGDRVCFAAGPNTAPVCCALGHYCDLDLETCCAIGKICHTGKKVRIRY